MMDDFSISDQTNPIYQSNEQVQQDLSVDENGKLILKREVTDPKTHFDGKISTLKNEFPEMYKAVEAFLSQEFLHQLRKDQERLKQAMKEYNKQ